MRKFITKLINQDISDRRISLVTKLSNNRRSPNPLVILEEPFVGLWYDFRTPLLLQALAGRAAFPRTVLAIKKDEG